MKIQNATAFTAKESEVRECVCSHSYQDQKHGKGMRVHNPYAKGWRCTVCNRETITWGSGK